jgi:uncharacterized membrane protein YuzA (DUF378 family)
MEDGMLNPEKEKVQRESLLKTPIPINGEVIFFIVILVLAVMTRFIDVGSRVMSHDENTHVYFSWQLEQGQGYSHDPLSHGPLQFHLVALSFFLFGDTDATARFPAAICGVAAVMMVFIFRKWLGKKGTAAAAVLMLVSPYMLFYSRYVRNEILVVPQALLLFWAMFRYMESRKSTWLYLLVLALSLDFATKETAFMYTAALLVYLGLHFGWELLKHEWKEPPWKVYLFVSLVVLLAGGGLAGWSFLKAIEEDYSSSGVVLGMSSWIFIGTGMMAIGLAGFLWSLIKEFGKELRTRFPAFNMIVVILTLILPQLAAVIATIGGWDPLVYDVREVYIKTVIAIIALAVIAVGIGSLWDWKRWFVAAGVFYVPFSILYTTFFTNGEGLATGLVGSLGYWIVQQGVERGSQPMFYYAFLQIPVYEYLPALGVLLAAWFGLTAKASREGKEPKENAEAGSETAVELEGLFDEGTGLNTDGSGKEKMFPAVSFFGYWTVMMLGLFTYAGERMPWLTIHIALPMILLAGWAIGKFLDNIDWNVWKKGWYVVAVEIVLLISILGLLGTLLGVNPPFQGQTLFVEQKEFVSFHRSVQASLSCLSDQYVFLPPAA